MANTHMNVMFNITNYQGNANRNHNITSSLLEWLLSKSQEITSVGEDVEKREPSCTVGENVNQCSHCGKQYGGSSKKQTTQSKNGQKTQIDISPKKIYRLPQTHERMLNIINHQRNANQNYNEISSHTGQNGHHQKIYKQ